MIAANSCEQESYAGHGSSMIVGVKRISPLLALLAAHVDSSPRYIEVAAGERIAVTEMGAGPGIVVVPGMLGSAFGFRHVTPQLIQAGFRVIVVEPLGTGASHGPPASNYSLTAQADRIGAVLDTLGAERNLLLCHAVSGSMCLRLAYRRPEHVAGIVSINGGAAERAASDHTRRMLKLSGVVKLFTGDGFIRNKVRDGLIKSSADASWVTEETLVGYLAPFGDKLDRVLESIKRMASASEPEPLAPNLSRVEVPVLLLVGTGTRDGAVPGDELEALQTHLAELQVDSIPGAGLYIHEERPEAVIEAVLRMAASLHLTGR